MSNEDDVRRAEALLAHPTKTKHQRFAELDRDEQIFVVGMSARHGRLARGLTYMLPPGCRIGAVSASLFVDDVLARFPDLQRAEPESNAICRKDSSS